MEQELQNEPLLVSSSNSEPPAGDDVTQSQPLNTETPMSDDSGNEINSSSNDETSMKKDMDIDKKLASEVEEYLGILKESSCKICLNIIEGCDVREAHENESWQPHNACRDSQGVVIVISNFLLDHCHTYPSLESSIGSELLRRLKFCLEDPRRQSKDNIKLPSVSYKSSHDDFRCRPPHYIHLNPHFLQHCQVKVGHESSFAALVHTAVVFFRALPNLRPLVLRHGLVGMITHCVRSCTLSLSLQCRDVETRLVWPIWLAPGKSQFLLIGPVFISLCVSNKVFLLTSALLLMEVMATPTSIILDEEMCEEGGQAKLPSKRSEYGKVLAVSL